MKCNHQPECYVDEKSITQLKKSSSVSLTQKYSPIYRKVMKKNISAMDQLLKTPELNKNENYTNNQQQLKYNVLQTTLQQTKKNECYKQLCSIVSINSTVKLPELQYRKISISVDKNYKKQQTSFANSLQSPTYSLKLKKLMTIKGNEHQTQLKDQEFRKQIRLEFNQLNMMIQKISQSFDQRLSTHQNQLLKIMLNQIKRIQQECEWTIAKYNELIKNKVHGVQINQIRNQANYFKNHSLQLNKQNLQLKKQIKYLKKLNNQYELKINIDSQAIKNIQTKYVNEKQKCKKLIKKILSQEKNKTQKHDQQPLFIQNRIPINNQQIPHLQKCISSMKVRTECTQIHKFSSVCQNKQSSKQSNFTPVSNNHRQFKKKQIDKFMILKKIKTQHKQQNITSKKRYQSQASIKKQNKTLILKYQDCQLIEKNFNNKFHNSAIQINHKQTEQFPINKQQFPINKTQFTINQQANGQRIRKFLKQIRPSIKDKIKYKKNHNKSQQKILNNQDQSINNKIQKIIHKVKMSSFQQERWQKMRKNSIQTDMEEYLFKQKSY